MQSLGGKPALSRTSKVKIQSLSKTVACLREDRSKAKTLLVYNQNLEFEFSASKTINFQANNLRILVSVSRYFLGNSLVGGICIW